MNRKLFSRYVILYYTMQITIYSMSNVHIYSIDCILLIFDSTFLPILFAFSYLFVFCLCLGFILLFTIAGLPFYINIILCLFYGSYPNAGKKQLLYSLLTTMSMN